ncbi:hypothetical protein [Ramlibacter sp.]|uniref:hypothetical protein n=1 Tax=Ramlibacter sp. TaxID=1917967 RepID=UPI002629931B|nr:hypothetical protein [Ramlibacter sp.]MDB5957515.1 hypothetical protein [Ramlibacter sp.]
MDIHELLPVLVPKAITWAKSQEAAILRAGVPLSPSGIGIAQRVGVVDPTRVRLQVVPAIPTPDDPVMARIVVEQGVFGPHTGGVTLGYGIYLVAGKWNDQLVAHELRHVHQYESLGGVEGFMPVYLAQIAQCGYRDAPLERDARAAAGEPV